MFRFKFGYSKKSNGGNTMKRFLSVFSALVLVSGFGLAGCSDDDDSSSGGQGAEFDATLYYTKAELDDGALDARYYTESEINSDYYTATEVDALLPETSNTTRFLDGLNSSGTAATYGWDSRTDDHSDPVGDAHPYAGWVIPSNAKYCLFELTIENCSATDNAVTFTWAKSDETVIGNLTIQQSLFTYSTICHLVEVHSAQGDTVYAYIGEGSNPGITYGNPISIRPVAYFK